MALQRRVAAPLLQDLLGAPDWLDGTVALFQNAGVVDHIQNAVGTARDLYNSWSENRDIAAYNELRFQAAEGASRDHYASKRALEHSPDSPAMEGEPAAKQSRNDPERPIPLAAGAASWSAGGAGAPVGSVVQNVIGPSRSGGHTETFRSCGAFFFNDVGSHNDWASIPWEFPLIFIKNRKIWGNAMKYRYWRTKAIKIRISMPAQKYSYIPVAGTTYSGTDMSSRSVLFCDNDRVMGVPFHPGWSYADYKKFITGFPTGFDQISNAPYYLPNMLDISANAVSTAILDSGTTDFSPSTEMFANNVGSAVTREYYPTNRCWRSVHEFACTPELRGTTSVSAGNNLYPDPYILGDAEAISVFRADNAGCRLISPGLSQLPNIGTGGRNCKWSYTHPATSYSNAVVTPAGGAGGVLNSDRPTFCPTRVFMDAGTYGQITLSTHGTECIEPNPQPQMYISYKNIIGTDMASIMNQTVMFDVSYTWEVEFSGEILPTHGATMIDTGNREYPNTTRYYGSIMKNPCAMDPNYIAIPFYNINQVTNDSCPVPLSITAPVPADLITPKRLLGLRNADTEIL